MASNGEEVLAWDDLSFFESMYYEYSVCPHPEFYEINSPFGMMTQKKVRQNKKKLSPFLFINDECDYLSIICSKHLMPALSLNPIANSIAMDMCFNEPVFPTFNRASTSSLGYCALQDGDTISMSTDEPQLYENREKKMIKINMRSSQFYIPPTSRFIISDISICNQLIYRDEKFDCIIMDPAWPNKAVRRQRTYAATTFDLINQIPLDGLLSDNGIFMIWVTNSPTVRDWTRMLLQNWGLEQCGEIFWIKTTKTKSPVYSFNRIHKMPYEKVILATREQRRTKCYSLQSKKVIMSVPHASSSRKPPIAHILRDQIRWSNGLELFGRYLLPDTLTIGDQSLKFQEEYYFTNKNTSIYTSSIF